MVKPTKLFWKADNNVLRFLIGTLDFRLWYKHIKGEKLQGFTNADLEGIPSNRKSTSGGIFNIRSTTISWYNRTQRPVSLSSNKTE